ncbi:trinucleotide repeat-containing gene 6B protein isoform X2 [Stigmatopora nigra]
MEDKKRKKEDKRKREASQKVTEQKNKGLDLSKQASVHPPGAPSSSASPSPGAVPSGAPSPATSGPGCAAAQSQGGNNAKRLAVANGQPASASAASSCAGVPGSAGGGGGAAQQQARYMPREVPPRFRCQQDHKVLLKRGQPPLSSMLLGGGGSGEGSGANAAAISDPGAATSSLALPSSSVAASTTTSNYANSTWGTSLGNQASSQGREKVIVDGNDLEEWPSIAGSDGGGGASLAVAGGGGGLNGPSGNNNGMPVNSISASGSQSSSTSLFSLPNECMQSSASVAWGTAAAHQGHLGGGGGNAVASAGPALQQSASASKAGVVPASHDASGLVDRGGGGGIPVANFNPNANPSAWPALVQQEGPGGGEGGPSSFHHQGPGGNLSANNNSASVGAKATADGVLGAHQAFYVNQSNPPHQHQLHQMQSRDREMAAGKWDGQSAGPKIAGEEEGAGDDHNLLSSWRRQNPYPAPNSKTGAPGTDGWEGDGSAGWAYPGPSAGVHSWGAAGTNDGQTQGGWGASGVGVEKGVSGGVDWGASSCAAGEVGGGACSSNSSSSGCSTAANPAVASSTLNRAWDNQKGEGETGEWCERGAGGAGSSGGNSRCERDQNGGRPRRQTPDTEAALQSLLGRPDLDPRVLSNTGWGQTQIRQNTSWDLEGQAEHNKSAKHPTSLGNSSQYSRGPVGDSNRPGVHPPCLSSAGSSGEAWESSSSSSSSGGASLNGRAPPPSAPNVTNHGVSQSGPAVAGGTGGGGGGTGPPLHNQQGKASGWGAVDNQETKGWANEEWRTNRGNGGGWGGAMGQQGNPASAGWGGGNDDRGAGWKEMGGEGRGGGWGSGQKVGAGRDWGEQDSKSNNGGTWEDPSKNGGRNSAGDSGAWGSWDDEAQRRSWGAGGGGGGGTASKAHPTWSAGNKMQQMPNSQSASITGLQAQQQQSQGRNQPTHLPQALDQGAMQGHPAGRKAISQSQNQNSGWTSGPIPACHAIGSSGSETSGWEEPSPPSSNRKNEIDDGTSAWGDPTHYNYKPVNLWDKNSNPAGPTQPQRGPSPQTQQLNRPAPGPPGGGRDFSAGHGQGKPAAIGSSGWGGTPPASPTVDNGTSAWGKPTDVPSGWGEPDDAGGKSGWGNPPSNSLKAGSKSMQDSWGDKEGSVTASRHSSWEDEEESGSMWNSAGSQGSGSSWGQGSTGGWAQSHNVKKASNKGPLKVGGGDSWMSPMNRQFSNMGLLNDDQTGGANMDLTSGALQEKKIELEKRAMGMMDYNGDARKARGGLAYRCPVSKEAAAGDTVSFYDKSSLSTNQDGYLGEDAPCSVFSPATAYKAHSLFNHTIPFRQGGHNLLGSSGGMSQSRHQPGNVPTVNASPGIRAQVPHQFLSPQVPSSMLKQMPPPSGSVGGVAGVGGVGSGVGGGVFPPQLSPQQIAMLSSIYPPHIQFQLACQLLLQQQQQQQPQQQLLQNQRKFPPNVRQQADPQQLARIMAIVQQQQRQQVGGTLGGNIKLSPSHHGGGGAKLHGGDSLPHQGLAASVADLHQKTLGPYSSFSSGVNLPGLGELGGSVVGPPGALKDMGAQQSRFKWMMEGHASPDTSSPENAFHKNGPVNPMKMAGGSPYSQYDMIVGDAQGGGGGNWHRTPGKMSSNKPSAAPSWPPEFQPGVPWKGIDRVDPETDPYMTPGSMMGNTASPGLNDSEHQLLQDNSAKYTDYKSGWPPEPIGHKSWKASRGNNQAQMSRPPPGLASHKQISSTPWSSGAPRLAGRGWSSGSGSAGVAWSDGSSRESCWLVLSNLTPQIDGSTLRTICMQHGPLLTFHLGLTQGSALIRYGSKQEAAKAQSALHMCVLGNTTILAEFVSEEDVARYIAHSQAGAGSNAATATGSVPSSTVSANGGGGACDLSSTATAGGGGVGEGGSSSSSAGTSVPSGHSESSWQNLEGPGGSSEQSAAPALGIFSQWSANGAGAGAEAGRQALWGSVGGMGVAGGAGGYPASSLWASPVLEDRHQMGSPASLLPGDLLGGGADSI